MDEVLGCGMVVVVVIMCVLLALAVYMTVQGSIVSNECLRCGWYDSTTSMTIPPIGYCGREENEYEIVKPLSWVLENDCNG